MNLIVLVAFWNTVRFAVLIPASGVASADPDAPARAVERQPAQIALAAHQVGYCIVTTLNRFSRRPEDAAGIEQALSDAPVAIVVAADRIGPPGTESYSRVTTPAPQL